MKRLLIILPLLFIGCKKKDTTPTTPPTPATCNCYQIVYAIGAGGTYHYDHTTSTTVELCAKDGTVEYQGSGVYKFVWVCQ